MESSATKGKKGSPRACPLRHFVSAGELEQVTKKSSKSVTPTSSQLILGEKQGDNKEGLGGGQEEDVFSRQLFCGYY